MSGRSPTKFWMKHSMMWHYFQSVGSLSCSGCIMAIVMVVRPNPIHSFHTNFKLPCSNMKLKYSTPKEIEKIIKSLKSKTSHGYDGIPMKILKVSTRFITSPLTYTCNKPLSSGIFPSQLKFSEIKPLHKKWDRIDITNFRPISLITFFSKILEKVIYIYKIVPRH